VKILIIVILLTAAALHPALADDAASLTPVELNSHPEQYDAKYVSVHGFIVNGFESHGIWQDADSEKTDAKNCVSVLYAGTALTKDIRKINGKEVVASGVFSKNIFADHKFVAMGSCNRTAITVDKIEVEK
jgi:cytochrome c-type biogenesis protein CcmE